jgi:ERCC4-type nuclease
MKKKQTKKQKNTFHRLEKEKRMYNATLKNCNNKVPEVTKFAALETFDST